MAIDKSLVSGSTTMLILKLLEQQDMYGYQMIEELSNRSDNTFELKVGTLYPLLHGLEKQGLLNSYDDNNEGKRVRKYYHLTSLGSKMLQNKQKEWRIYEKAINLILRGDALCETL